MQNLHISQKMCIFAKNIGDIKMTEITLKVTDDSLMPMLRKLFNAIDGVEIEKKRKKTGIELAFEDVEAGRVYSAKDGADLISKCLSD